MLRQLSLLFQSIVWTIIYRFRDPIKILKVELENKKQNFKKSWDALADSMGKIEYKKDEIKKQEDRIADIDNYVLGLTKDKSKDEETRRRIARDYLIEKHQLNSDLANLKEFVSNSEKSIEMAQEKLKDFETDILETELKINSLELKKQINTTNKLLTNNLSIGSMSSMNDNFKEAEKEISQESFLLEAKAVLSDKLIKTESVSSAKMKADTELNSLDFSN